MLAVFLHCDMDAKHIHIDRYVCPGGRMSNTEHQKIAQIVGSYVDEYTGLPLSKTQSLGAIEVNDDSATIEIILGYPAASVVDAMAEAISAQVIAESSISSATVNISSHIQSRARSSKIASLDPVKNIIAIASGKGGVGKSATALNVALALHLEGAKVGLLDADIYGPSQPLMLGVPSDRRPEVQDQKYFIPIEAYGLQTMSMGYLVTDKTPMVWRGPMVSGALTQMVNQTLWQDLDYLIIDMPPGTGDIQLTLSQQVPVTGAAVVTTPQDIALLDAKKGIEMFRKVNVPCLGIIENMSTHVCSECGHNEAIFGDGGGERIADEYDVPLLGKLPLALEIRKGLDEGKPLVAVNPDSLLAAQYRHIARKLAAQLCIPDTNTEAMRAGPKIIVSND